jgi:hypothetical protein
MNGNASEWLGAVGGVVSARARLWPVVVERMDALDPIRREDGDGTLFYCDPSCTVAALPRPATPAGS